MLFAARAGTTAIHLTPTGATFLLIPRTAEALPLTMQFVEGNPAPQVSGAAPLPGIVNYFEGNDPAGWRTEIPTFAAVVYHEVYPGIDVRFFGTQEGLQYDFILAPHADPRAIRLAFSGAAALTLEANGDLLIEAGGPLHRHRQWGGGGWLYLALSSGCPESLLAAARGGFGELYAG